MKMEGDWRGERGRLRKAKIYIEETVEAKHSEMGIEKEIYMN